MKINVIGQTSLPVGFLGKDKNKKADTNPVQKSDKNELPLAQVPIIEKIYTFDELECNPNFTTAVLKETGEKFSGTVKDKVGELDVTYRYRNGLIKTKQEGNYEINYKRQADDTVWQTIETYKTPDDADYYRKTTRYNLDNEKELNWVQIEYFDGTRFFTSYNDGLAKRMVKYEPDGTCVVLLDN